MTEEFAIESFVHFSDDLDDKMRKRFKKFDHTAYYYVITRNEYWNRRDMAHDKNDIYKYTFVDLYDEMCNLFFWLDDGDKDMMYKIIILKNFINYKMHMERTGRSVA